jgi:hypothetical protein
MNEPLDPLEAELAALRPHDLTPATRENIARRLTAGRLLQRRWLLGLAGAAAAACAAIVIIWVLSQRPNQSNPQVPGPSPVPVAIETPSPTAPTLWAYQQALAESVEKFEALSAPRPQTSSAADPPPMSALASTLTEESWTQLLGDR